MMLITNAFVVFALTLIITKSKIMAGKREFVEQRYEAAKVGNQRPSCVHGIWHAIITCPMCSGFWFSIPIALLFPVYNIFLDVLVLFALNWIIHCIENFLFFGGETLEKTSDLPLDELAEKSRRILRELESYMRSRK